MYVTKDRPSILPRHVCVRVRVHTCERERTSLLLKTFGALSFVLESGSNVNSGDG